MLSVAGRGVMHDERRKSRESTYEEGPGGRFQRGSGIWTPPLNRVPSRYEWHIALSIKSGKAQRTAAAGRTAAAWS